MRNILLVTLLFLCVTLFSQNTSYTVKGAVSDSINHEPLSSVTIEVAEHPQQNTFTDDSGNYELSLPSGQYSVSFKLLGHYQKTVNLRITKDRRMNIELIPESVKLGEVIVSGFQKKENIKNVQMGVEKLNIETTSKIPVLLGESDILKTLQLLPGVQSAGEGNIGFYVRGGAGDQNLILLDNATVYNPSHLFGFFSTFNSDAVQDFTLYKGSMPAQYGGRLSSTLDINMRDGDLRKYKVKGGIGLISSRIAIEGPIQKDRSSFLFSARRTYADVLARAIGVEEVKNSTLYFYDLNAKLTYMLSKKDKLTLTAYHGIDKLGLDGIAGFDWGNTIASLKWNHIFNEKTTSNTTFSYTNYKYNVGVELTTGIDIFSRIQDFNFDQSFNFYPNPKNRIKIGFSSVYHHVIPGELRSRDENKLKVTPFDHRYSWENVIYASNNIKISDRLEIDYGLRLSTFSVLGGGNFYTYDNNQQVVDTIRTGRSDFVKTYWNLEPRFSFAYQLDDNSSVKAGYTRSTQNFHLLTTSDMVSPTDRWVANTNYIKPEIGNQVSLGYFRNFMNDTYEFGAEVYYKTLDNQIDFKNGAETYDKDNVETELLFGEGRTYGLEVFLKKRVGRLNGWISYTLSKSEKKIEKINNFEWYPSNQDRRHNLSVVGIFELSKKWTISGTWVYASGSPMTFPSGKYVVDGHILYHYEGRNKQRAAAFHRLDLGATCILKQSNKFYSELTFSIYNAYGRKNPYLYGFRQSKEDKLQSESYMIYLFSIIPSVSWNFKF